MHFKYSEAFAGAGAWGKAIKRVTDRHSDTCELQQYWEFDKHASNCFAAIHDEPESKNEWDITKECKVKHCNIFFYSPPCQTYSIAGKREGATVNKGNLFYNAMEKLGLMNPEYAIMENVKGLPSGDTKKDFNAMLWHLESLGYYNYWTILNSKDYGIPQNRERVFIVSIRSDIYAQGKRFEFPKPIKLEKCLHDVLLDQVDKKYYLSQKLIDCLVFKDNDFKGEFKPKENGDIANCLDTREGGRRTNNFIKSELNQIGYINSDSQGQRVYDANGISVTLSSLGGGLGAKTGLYIGASRGRNVDNPNSRKTGLETVQHLEINKDGVCNTITTVQKDNLVVKSATNCGYEIASPGDSITLEHPNSKTRRGRVGVGVSQTLTTSCNIGYYNGHTIRRLHPLETFRLQGFDDADYYKAVDSYDKTFTKGKSDTQMYIRMGNTITVNVIEEILENLLYDRQQKHQQLSLF